MHCIIGEAGVPVFAVFGLNRLYYNIKRAGTPVFIVHGLGSAFSSIGMAKAALEAINGLNLFGDRGANWSVVYIDIDAHFRNRTTFDSLLPRESASKVTAWLEIRWWFDGF